MRTISFLFLLVIVISCNDHKSSPTINSDSQKVDSIKVYKRTDFFRRYDNENAYKGIRFGSTYNNIRMKLGLTKKLMSEPLMYSIENSEYLKYGCISFNSGVAYFNKDGSLYSVVLYIDSLDSSRYANYLAYFTEYYGDNEIEKDGGHWTGKNINIDFDFYKCSNKVATDVKLGIYNTRLNNAAVDDLFESTENELKKEVIPSM